MGPQGHPGARDVRRDSLADLHHPAEEALPGEEGIHKGHVEDVRASRTDEESLRGSVDLRGGQVLVEISAGRLL